MIRRRGFGFVSVVVSRRLRARGAGCWRWDCFGLLLRGLHRSVERCLTSGHGVSLLPSVASIHRRPEQWPHVTVEASSKLSFQQEWHAALCSGNLFKELQFLFEDVSGSL